eukprot:scaffold42659_cov62-Phaeocystis_antarctica.AAC.12
MAPPAPRAAQPPAQLPCIHPAPHCVARVDTNGGGGSGRGAEREVVPPGPISARQTPPRP